MRCYVLLLNIWFYGIYIYLFITKARHIKWIIISPTVLGLIVSIGFWSIPNITRHVLTAELNELLDNKKITISDFASFEETEEYSKSTGSYSRGGNTKKVKGKLKYLKDTYREESIQQFFIR
jgi:hypothetical protein